MGRTVQTALRRSLYTCGGIFHFEEYIKKKMKKGDNLDGLVHSIAERSPGLVVVSREIGYGLVPVDAFERGMQRKNGTHLHGTGCTGIQSRPGHMWDRSSAERR